MINRLMMRMIKFIWCWMKNWTFKKEIYCHQQRGFCKKSLKSFVRFRAKAMTTVRDSSIRKRFNSLAIARNHENVWYIESKRTWPRTCKNDHTRLRMMIDRAWMIDRTILLWQRKQLYQSFKWTYWSWEMNKRIWSLNCRAVNSFKYDWS